MWQLFIPGRLPGLNDIIEAQSKAIWVRGKSGKRVRLSKYAQMKSEMGGRIELLARAQKLPVLSTPSHFHYHFHERDRGRDPSNIMAGAVKIIEDGLQQCNRLLNDNWCWVLSISASFSSGSCHPEGITVTAREYAEKTAEGNTPSHTSSESHGEAPGGAVAGPDGSGAEPDSVRRRRKGAPAPG
jgi:hypothetical protein